MIQLLGYCSFWAMLSLVASGIIAIISFGIFYIVIMALINIPFSLFVYFSYKLGKIQSQKHFAKEI